MMEDVDAVRCEALKREWTDQYVTVKPERPDAGMDREYGAEDACRFVKRLDFEPAPRGNI